MDGLRARVDALGCDWSTITASQVYTVHDFRPILESLFTELGISQIGVAWYPGWPPVSDMTPLFSCLFRRPDRAAFSVRLGHQY